MGKLKFEIIRELIPHETKLKEVERYGDDAIYFLEPGYLDRDIYNEYVMMKCLDCDYEMKHELDILAEIMHMYGMKYPEDACYDCSNGTMVPKDIHAIKKRKKH